MKRLAFVGILPVAALILAAFFPLVNAEACTRMFWNTNGEAMLVGRNMDFDLDDLPVFYVFPEGISKNGGVDNPAMWTSQYGSLVVTHLGNSKFSVEGLNTAGLAFHFLYLNATQYEYRDGRPGVLNVSFGEYLLDNAATVSDAIRLMYQTQVVAPVIAGRVWPFHLALEDASGDAAIVEFVGGHMNVYHGPGFNTLTNDPPLPQMPDLADYQYFGGSLPLPGDNNAQSRFVRASAFVSSLNFAFSSQALKPTPVSAMFTAIRAITEPFGSVQYVGPGGVAGPTPVAAWPTTWTMVSDLTNKAVYFSHNMVRNNFWIDMKKLNFSAGAPIRSLNAERPDLAGEVSGLFSSPSPGAISLLLWD
jgi:penicillin V acylase-like amidase (Ntn superfamily)